MTNSGRITNKNNFKQTKMLTEDLYKYSGNKKVIELLSSYEIKAVRMIQQLAKLGRLDGWASEESVFQYEYSIDGKFHRYYMDFTLQIGNKVVFVEVKPKSEVLEPKKPKNFKNEKAKENYKKRVLTFIKNQDKWSAVKDWCDKHNSKAGYKKYSFVLWTEEELSI